MKKGEVIDETIDTRKGYYPEDIAGTFGVPVEEHKRQTQVTVEKGYINVAMLTADKKPAEIDEAGNVVLDRTSDHKQSIVILFGLGLLDCILVVEQF